MVPQLIQIESSTACSAACDFCPHSSLQRKMGSMTDALFLKIINDANNMGIKHILLFLNGEPLIFNRFFYWLEELRQRNMVTTIFTNASHLTEDKAHRLISYADVIRDIFFSVAGINKETCFNLTGLDFDTVVSNVKYFVNLNNGLIPIAAHMPLYSKTVAFSKQWKLFWSDVVGRADLTDYYNFAGLVTPEKSQRKKAFCGRLTHLTVLYDGRVCLCCMNPETSNFRRSKHSVYHGSL